MEMKTVVLPRYVALLLATWLFTNPLQAQPGGGAGGPPPPTPVSVAAVQADKLVVDVNTTGSLAANESLTLRPEISGRIDEIKFKEGERVKAGAVLATLASSEYKARLAVSEANRKLQQISYERAERLFKQKLASSQEYDQAAAQFEEAKATHALNEEILRKTVLRAPFSGILGLRKVSPGDYTKEGADIVDIADIRTLKVDFQVPETAYREIKPGQALTVRVDSFPDETFKGELYVIAPKLDSTTRSLQLRARIDNSDERLRPGMFARITLHIAEKPSALLIPEESLWPMGAKQFVYRVVDDKVTLTPIATGYRRAGKVEIVSGLKPGDIVVTSGQMKIREGAAVKMLNAPSPAPAQVKE